jgi:succinate dehydrogenase hydrophobic anchor subunit
MDSSGKMPDPQNKKPSPEVPVLFAERPNETPDSSQDGGSSEPDPQNKKPSPEVPVLFAEGPNETPDSSQDEGSSEPEPQNKKPWPDEGELTKGPFARLGAKVAKVCGMWQWKRRPQPQPESIIRPDDDELTKYSAHEAVATQATAFLTYIITTVTLYVTVTGAAWGVVIANTFSASPTTKLCMLGLHILLSFGTAVGIWSVSNNFIQRLNLARWLGVVFWPKIQKIGGPEISWKGVPEGGTLKVLEYNKWKEDRKEKNKHNWFWLWYPDFWLRYRAPVWPSLRHQRLWALLPVFAGTVSVVFFWQIRADRYEHRLICDQVARTLSFPDNAPVSREVLDRARYLFEKTGCELSHIHLRPPGG